MKLETLVKTAVAALEDIKGRDISVLDVRRMTSLFDKLIIVSGESTRQNKALAGNVREKLKALGAVVYGMEGEENGEWILVDFGDVVVHIMQPAIRQHYNLEELWSGGPAEPLKRAVKASRPAKTSKPARKAVKR